MALKTFVAFALLFHVSLCTDQVPELEEALKNDDACSDEACSAELLQRSLSEKNLIKSSWLEDKRIDSTRCEPEVECSMDLGHLSINNLDGSISGLPAVIRFDDVCKVNCASANCQPVDFVITKTGPYASGKTWKNGKYGKFGSINVDAGTKLNLNFQFVKPGTMDEVSVDSFYFTVFDLDGWIDGATVHHHESISVSGFSKYALADDTTLKTTPAGSMVTFTSTVSGGLVDNPADPMVLRKPQAKKTVSFVFRKKSRFSAQFSVVGPNTYGQRNFMFAGQSPLTTTCTTTPSTGCSAEVACDFKLREVVSNNLLGDKSGDATVRYGNACSAKCKKLDLLVTKTSSYSAAKAHKNGLAGSMGTVNLDAGTSLDVLFTFVEEATTTPYKVGSFYFSVFDIDSWIDASGTLLQQERLTVTGFNTYSLTADSQLSVEHVAGGATFTSKPSGGVEDNPADPMVLRAAQAARSVSFLFSNKATFKARFEVVGPNRNGTRNFLFAGRSALAECSTTSEVKTKTV